MDISQNGQKVADKKQNLRTDLKKLRTFIKTDKKLRTKSKTCGQFSKIADIYQNGQKVADKKQNLRTVLKKERTKNKTDKKSPADKSHRHRRFIRYVPS